MMNLQAMGEIPEAPVYNPDIIEGTKNSNQNLCSGINGGMIALAIIAFFGSLFMVSSTDTAPTKPEDRSFLLSFNANYLFTSILMLIPIISIILTFVLVKSANKSILLMSLVGINVLFFAFFLSLLIGTIIHSGNATAFPVDPKGEATEDAIKNKGTFGYLPNRCEYDAKILECRGWTLTGMAAFLRVEREKEEGK